MAILSNVKPKAQAPVNRTTAATTSKGKSPYSGLAETELSKSRPRLKVGTYVLKVLQCRDGNLPEAIGGDFYFASDFEIVESSNDECPAGTEAGWMTVLGKFPQYFKQDVKAYLIAVTGAGESDITEESPAEATAEDNPLQGRLVIAQVENGSKVDPKTGNPYTKVRFMKVPEGAEQAA